MKFTVRFVRDVRETFEMEVEADSAAEARKLGGNMPMNPETCTRHVEWLFKHVAPSDEGTHEPRTRLVWHSVDEAALRESWRNHFGEELDTSEAVRVHDLGHDVRYFMSNGYVAAISSKPSRQCGVWVVVAS